EGLVLFGELDDELVCVGPPGGVFNIRVRGSVATISDIVPHRSIEQEYVLLDKCQKVAIGAEPKLSNVRAVEQDASLRWVVKASYEVRHRRFSRAAATHQSHHRATRHDDM